jgi:hypothetical protein
LLEYKGDNQLWTTYWTAIAVCIAAPAQPCWQQRQEKLTRLCNVTDAKARNPPFCATCGIKACALRKGYEFCYQCNELQTCELMQKFVADTQYPYGQCVVKNMETLQVMDLPKWLEMQDERWRCKNCGAPHSCYHETCLQCGQAVASYKADL